MKMFKYIVDKVGNWYTKAHRCKKHEELFSTTYEEYGGLRIKTGIETRCSVCGKTILKIGV